MTLKRVRENMRNVRVPERVGTVEHVFYMDGKPFGFHPVLPAEIKQGAAYNWQWRQ